MKLLTTPHRADCNGSKNLSRHVVRYTSFSYPILTGMEREVQIAKPNTGPRPASSIPIKHLSCAQLGAPEDAVTMAFCCKKKNRGGRKSGTATPPCLLTQQTQGHHRNSSASTQSEKQGRCIARQQTLKNGRLAQCKMGRNFFFFKLEVPKTTLLADI